MNRHLRTIVIITLLALLAAWLISSASWAADSPISPLPSPTVTATPTPTPVLVRLPYCGNGDVFVAPRATPGP